MRIYESVCSISKPNLKTMNRKELYAYVLTHREDEEAFHAYVDKLHALI